MSKVVEVEYLEEGEAAMTSDELQSLGVYGARSGFDGDEGAGAAEIVTVFVAVFVTPFSV